MYFKNIFQRVGALLLLGFCVLSYLFLFSNAGFSQVAQEEIDFTQLDEADDLTTLKHDLGEKDELFDSSTDLIQKDQENQESKAIVAQTEQSINESIGNRTSEQNIKIFDVGEEEKKLLTIAKYVQFKISENDWQEIVSNSKLEKYTVADGEYLWKISQNLFGTGFYYSKIWSLNPYITNPHEIKPGMVLVFSRGDSLNMPEVRVGSFDEENRMSTSNDSQQNGLFDFSKFGDEAMPDWVREKKQLLKDGNYFQFSNDKSYEDLKKVGDISLVDEYERYAPPQTRFSSGIQNDQYDENGFSKDSKINYDFKEGLSLTTFITSNLVQDLGEIDSAIKPSGFISQHEKVFVRFNPTVNVIIGDLFSIYSPLGPVSHKMSDRHGHKYVIAGEIKVLRRVGELWECEVTSSSTIIQRKDRITVHTPPLSRIISTFNSRNIEVMVIDNYSSMVATTAYGEVVFLDRGRADGVEVGNVFELYSFHDELTDRKISRDPTFKIGEVTVITLSDNFATALVTQSSQEIPIGTFGATKTKEKAALKAKLKNKDFLSKVKQMEIDALDHLDVELNLNDLNEDLLNEAKKIEISEDELSELDKQERDKSFIEQNDSDLKELENLENEIEGIEALVNEKKVDEDKLLENQDLNQLESKGMVNAKDIFDNLNSIEKEEGKKFADQDINGQENPYGLSKFDVEEVNALINTLEPIDEGQKK